MTVPAFAGYLRPDGSVGVRNLVGILSVMDNINPVTRAIHAAVAGTVPITTLFVRGQYGTDEAIAFRTLAGLGRNPNLAAVLVVGLEQTTTRRLVAGIEPSRKPVEYLAVAESGGTVGALAEGIRRARNLVIEASRCRRTEVSVSNLTLGVECGGSDTTSGLASNPVIGKVADWLIANGGRVIISETAEFIGAELRFADRAESNEIRREILTRVARLENAAIARGIDMRGTNPVPDNIRGGLTTIEEKSLGAISKAGSTAVVGVLDYAEAPQKAGLHFMDTPAAAVESMTALASGGAQVIAFATGVGNPIANAVAPTIKVCANVRTLEALATDIDFDASRVLEGSATIDSVGEELAAFLSEVASGTLTSGEVLKFQETAISRFEPSI